MSSTLDYYDILGVPRDVDQNTIKKAYHKLALKMHPDRNLGNPDAKVEFQKLSGAYGVLSDPVKRAKYDQLGHARHVSSWSSSQDTDTDSTVDGLANLFATFFGNPSSASATVTASVDDVFGEFMRMFPDAQFEETTTTRRPKSFQGRQMHHTTTKPSTYKTVCRYGVGCTRGKTCSYFHPLGFKMYGPCKFGMDCTRSGCWFHHPNGKKNM